MVVAFTMGGLYLGAQTFKAEYTSEIQTTFSACNFVNLLHLEGSWNLGELFSVEASTISIAHTSSERLVQDLQTFSNIEEENLPLALAVCGINLNLGRHTLFAGVRNVNEDYFTGDITSFYTNSSCGIFPTISCNHPIPNYPLSALGLHYSYRGKTLGVKASVYNGVGNNQLWGRNSLFQFRPREDGRAIFSEADYHTSRSHYYLGNAVYCRRGVCSTPWFYTEQTLNGRISLIAGYSHAFGRSIESIDFLGIGAHYRMKNAELGIFADQARFREISEWATELTCKVALSEHVEIQPIVHLILTGDHKNSVCCIRVGLKS